MAPEPINPLEYLIRLFLLIVLGFAAYFSIGGTDDHPVPISPPDGGGSDGQPSGSEVLTVVESVEPIILESYPYQIQLHVTGYQPDGCLFPVQVEQTREGNAIHVRIYRVLPPDIMCTMQLVPYDETISLEGGFESGEYAIEVNGTIVNLSL